MGVRCQSGQTWIVLWDQRPAAAGMLLVLTALAFMRSLVFKAVTEVEKREWN